MRVLDSVQLHAPAEVRVPESEAELLSALVEEQLLAGSEDV